MRWPLLLGLVLLGACSATAIPIGPDDGGTQKPTNRLGGSGTAASGGGDLSAGDSMSAGGDTAAAGGSTSAGGGSTSASGGTGVDGSGSAGADPNADGGMSGGAEEDCDGTANEACECIEDEDCGAPTPCLKRECVANSCETTSLTQCTGPLGQPGTCDLLGTCLYCGDGVWSQATEQCDESVARWEGACQACSPTYFLHCKVYSGQTTCPAGETCAFSVCARTCNSVLDCPPEPSITCQELLVDGQSVCVWACPSPDDSRCPDSQMICDNANFCTFPANL